MEEVIELTACEVNYFIGKDGMPHSQIWVLGKDDVIRLTYVCRPYGIHFIEMEKKDHQVLRFYDIHSTTWQTS